jgi:hypothetical protein
VTLDLRDSPQETTIDVGDNPTTTELQSKSLQRGIGTEKAKDFQDVRIFDKFAMDDLAG